MWVEIRPFQTFTSLCKCSGNFTWGSHVWISTFYIKVTTAITCLYHCQHDTSLSQMPFVCAFYRVKNLTTISFRIRLTRHETLWMSRLWSCCGRCSHVRSVSPLTFEQIHWWSDLHPSTIYFRNSIQLHGWINEYWGKHVSITDSGFH